MKLSNLSMFALSAALMLGYATALSATAAPTALPTRATPPTTATPPTAATVLHSVAPSSSALPPATLNTCLAFCAGNVDCEGVCHNVHGFFAPVVACLKDCVATNSSDIATVNLCYEDCGKSAGVASVNTTTGAGGTPSGQDRSYHPVNEVFIMSLLLIFGLLTAM